MKRRAIFFSVAVLALSLTGCASMPWQPATTSVSDNIFSMSPGSPSSRMAFHSGADSLRPRLFTDSGSSEPVFRLQSDDTPSAEIYFDSLVFLEDLQNDEALVPEFEPFYLTLLDDTRQDHRNFYSLKNLPVAASLLGVGAWLANTNQDQHLLEDIQDNITFNGKTNEYQQFVEEFKFFGEGYFLLPIYASAAILGKYRPGGGPAAQRTGEWGDRCFRAIIVGTPALLISQKVIGGSRPGELSDIEEGSDWHFMEDDNGVSGHAFMGAIPFLTAFHMTKDVKFKVLYFTASTLPALSRITENGHYPSQALLGWGLAYLATSSIARTASEDVEVAPFISDHGVGLGVTIKH